ncbi:MAG TPA: TraM recognition domain-containing protein, partial [Candidatus Saccharimonadales bacterium]|nr:TraM recognition domain-containing protein [Candidatus Saccharimonadales bacterium]
ATVLNNHLAKVVLTGISDPDTLEMVSKLLGEEEYAQVSRSAQLERAGGAVSETVGTRRLAPMDLIRRMPPGQGCLIYGSLPPAHLVLRPYFSERLTARKAQSATGTPPASAQPLDARSGKTRRRLRPVGQQRQ